MKLLIIYILLCSSLFAGMRVYVSHDSKINAITVQEIKDLYLKKTTLLNNLKVTVYDNKEDYTLFNNLLIKKSDPQIHAYWMKHIFSGKRIPPPKVMSSKIITLLKNDPSAISYSKKNLDLKVIYEYK